jgi:serine/threonine-protein kinase
VSDLVRLGRYRIGQKLGEGGMAEVFCAEVDGAEGFSKTVAIKRVRPALGRDPAIREAFLAEADVARRLQHGNIVQIHDLGVEDELPYLVVEHIDGVSLAELAGSDRYAAGRLSVGDSLYVIEHVAAALDYAHRLTDAGGRSSGVIHRDVNPRNILLSRDGVVKLADFGIAKPLTAPSATLPGFVKGTVGYLAPEQACGQPIDARTDQFATGVVLYLLLAGRNPLAEAPDLERYRTLLLRGMPRLPVAAPVDEALAAIVARATEHEPGARFPTMGDLRAELEAWRVARNIRAEPDGVRRAVRGLLGDKRTDPALALDRALADQLGGPAQARTRTAGTAPRGLQRRRWAVAALVAAAALAIAVTGFLAQGSGSPVTAAGAVSDATAPLVEVVAPPAQVVATVQGDAGAAAASLRSEPPSERRSPDAAASLRRAPSQAPGRLMVNLVPWATVTVDGRARGRTPVNIELAPGPHRVVLENPDTGQRLRHKVVVNSGQTVSITRW